MVKWAIYNSSVLRLEPQRDSALAAELAFCLEALSWKHNGYRKYRWQIHQRFWSYVLENTRIIVFEGPSTPFKPGRGAAEGDIKLRYIFSSDKGEPLSWKIKLEMYPIS